MNPRLRRLLARGAVLALFGMLTTSVVTGMRRYLSNRAENRRLALKVAEAEAAVARKKSLLGMAQKDDALIEAEARRQLGLIGPNEIEFRFTQGQEGAPETVDVSPPAS